MSAYDALDGSRYDAHPASHKASAASAWGRLGEPEAEAAKPAAAVPKAEPQTRVAACASRALPGLVVADGVCSVEDQEEPADSVRCRPAGEAAWPRRECAAQQNAPAAQLAALGCC